MTQPTFQRLLVHPIDAATRKIWEVRFNRAKKRNSLDAPFWEDIKAAFDYLAALPECRCIILTAEGTTFCAGLDLLYASSNLVRSENETRDVARKAWYMQNYVEWLQRTIDSIEKCNKPVIACIQGGCVGAGLDIATACDIRMCTEDAYFIVKEVDIGLAADTGILQRLPKVVGNGSWVREICFTCRRVQAKEASEQGLVSTVATSLLQLREEATSLAHRIASKSPIAILGTKYALNYSRDHTVEEGLHMQRIWNGGMLQTKDIQDAVSGPADKALSHFSNL